MGNYENGALTRQLIINACNRLFYEKGYNETSYADICAMAHVVTPLSNTMKNATVANVVFVIEWDTVA